MLVAIDENANAAAEIIEPAIVIGRNPQRFAIALTNGPAIKQNPPSNEPTNATCKRNENGKKKLDSKYHDHQLSTSV